MYRCNDCGRDFEEFLNSREGHGEEWHVCPYCKSESFGEYRNERDQFLYTEKTEAIDYIVTAIAMLNEGGTEKAIELLFGYIGELVGESPQIYKKELANLKVCDSPRLIEKLKVLVEVKGSDI